MTDPAAALASQLRNIEQATGRTIDDWTKTVAATELTKHGQIVAYLKREHGLTHGNANALARAARETSAGGPPTGSELLAAQYSGAKARLRPVYDEVVLTAKSLGDDVEVAIQKTGVSLRRAKQFAVVQAPSATRVRLGLNLDGTEPTPRLRATTGMCTHTVDLTDVDDIDDEVTGWLRAAYDQASSTRRARNAT